MATKKATEKETKITVKAGDDRLVNVICINAYNDGKLGRIVKNGERYGVSIKRFEELKALKLVREAE